MIKLPTVEEMLKAGVHFGHRLSKRHPKMQPYIFGSRNGVTIVDLEKTQAKLKEAMDFVKKVVSDNGLVVFVGSKKQAQEAVKKYAIECSMPYVTTRWMGGTLTNFDVIGKMIRKYKDMRAKQESGELAKYTKKEQSEINKYLNKMEVMVGGLLGLTKIPAAVFIVDLKMEETARAECASKGVPIIAITDTNINPDGIAYPIPANDDATHSIEMITKMVSAAAKEGLAERKPEVARVEAKPFVISKPQRAMRPAQSMNRGGGSASKSPAMKTEATVAKPAAAPAPAKPATVPAPAPAPAAK